MDCSLLYPRPRSVLKRQIHNPEPSLALWSMRPADPIPGATVVLQGSAGDHLTAVTKDDGSFALHDVTPGVTYQIAVAADEFADWSSSVIVDPGQEKSLGEIKLRIVAVQRAVTVNYSSKEMAAQQFKAEEQQRVLRFIPNMYVTYEPHPEPLTTKRKFALAYKGLTHPTFFMPEASWAGIQQAADTPTLAARVQKDMASGSGPASPTAPPKACWQCYSAIASASRSSLFLSGRRDEMSRFAMPS